MRISCVLVSALAWFPPFPSAPAGLAASAETAAQARVRNLGAGVLAGVGQGSGDHANVRRLLALRAEALRTLIGENPAEALRLAFPVDVIGILNHQVPGSDAVLEEHGAWEGIVEYLIFDAPDLRHSSERIVIRNGRSVASVHFSGPRPRNLKSGDRLSVSGVRVGDQIAAVGSKTTADPGTGASCNPTGAQNTAVLLVTFPGLAAPMPAQSIHDVFFGSSVPSLDGFWSEASYGKARAAGGVYGWYTLDRTYSCGEYQLLRDAAVRAADPELDFQEIHRLFIVFPNGSSCSWAGLSTVGCGTVASADGNFTASSSWLLANYLADGTQGAQLVTHEAGHGLGLNHAASRDFGAETLGPLTDPGTLSEYGDRFSTMGDWNLGHYSAQHKAQLGWLAEGTDYQTVQAGTSTAIQPLEAEGGVRALRVQRGSGNDEWLWLEYRQPLGAYDRTLPTQAFTGALAHYQDATTSGKTHLIDFTPETYSWLDPALAGNLSWTDPYTNLSLTISPGASLGVTVAYGSIPCVEAMPAIVLTPANASGSAGTLITYAVSVLNQDTASCGERSFELAALLPAGWSGALSAPAVTLGPGASVTTELTVTSSAEADAGTYDIGVSAGAEAAASAQAAYTVTPPAEPLTVTVSADPGPYGSRSTVPFSARVSSGTMVAGGASVTFAILRPNGSVAMQRVITAEGSGIASTSYKLGPKDPPGTYAVRATASYLGAAATGMATFTAR